MQFVKKLNPSVTKFCQIKVWHTFITEEKVYLWQTLKKEILFVLDKNTSTFQRMFFSHTEYKNILKKKDTLFTTSFLNLIDQERRYFSQSRYISKTSKGGHKHGKHTQGKNQNWQRLIKQSV